jgi:hypothetical protein
MASSITINLGDAFLLDTPPNSEHLYIAIAQTTETDYLFVNVTSRRPNSDTSCILLPGEDVPSFVAREISIEELGGLITTGSPIPKGFCSERILQQIQQGGLDSKRLKNKYKNALKIFLGIE